MSLILINTRDATDKEYHSSPRTYSSHGISEALLGTRKLCQYHVFYVFYVFCSGLVKLGFSELPPLSLFLLYCTGLPCLQLRNLALQRNFLGHQPRFRMLQDRNLLRWCSDLDSFRLLRIALVVSKCFFAPYTASWTLMVRSSNLLDLLILLQKCTIPSAYYGQRGSRSCHYH